MQSPSEVRMAMIDRIRVEKKILRELMGCQAWPEDYLEPMKSKYEKLDGVLNRLIDEQLRFIEACHKISSLL